MIVFVLIWSNLKRILKDYTIFNSINQPQIYKFGIWYVTTSLLDTIQSMKLPHAALFKLRFFTSPTIISPLSAWSKAEFSFLPISFWSICYSISLLLTTGIASSASTMIRSFLFHTEPFKGLIRRWKIICHWRGWMLSLVRILIRWCWSKGMRLESIQQQVICSSSVKPLFKTSATIQVIKKHSSFNKV